MPVYVYRCERCGSQFEKRQSFSDAPMTECEECHGTVRKVFTPATVIYKGSGFYSTDYNSKSGGNGKNGSDAKTEGGDKPESKSASESKDSSTVAAGSEKTSSSATKTSE